MADTALPFDLLPTPDWRSDCGTVALYLGDCREILPQFQPGVIDAVVTDPPYGIDGGRGGDSKRGKGKYETTKWADDEQNIINVVIPTAEWISGLGVPAAITPGNKYLWRYPEPVAIGVFWTPANPNHGPWGFTTHIPILYYGKDYKQGLGSSPSGRLLTEAAEPCGHPCPKPILAWTWLVEKVSPPMSIVFDPFAGSGTTGVACVRLGRSFIGCEIEPKYFDIAVRRIKAELAQPRLFAEPPRKPEQLTIGGGA